MFNRKLYCNAMEELRAPQNKIEEVIVMTQNQTEKKFRRPLRTAAVAAAAVAMLTLGVSAANPEGVQEFLYRVSAVIRLDDFRTEVTMEDGTGVSLLDVSQVAVETRGDRVVLVAGSEEIDITDGLAQDGRYVYEHSSEASELKVEVTGAPGDYEYTVTLGKAGDNGATFTFSGDSRRGSGPITFPEGDGTEIGITYYSETGEGEADGEHSGSWIITDPEN
ncbi:MAG: hypothetical protein HFF39_01280 [Lawsonibacter sp.]|nr:hypothetical protein [Lawsonibacter sp.]